VRPAINAVGRHLISFVRRTYAGGRARTPGSVVSILQPWGTLKVDTRCQAVWTPQILDNLTTTHAEALKSLMTLNFHRFEGVSLMAARGITEARLAA
jgi:hypothetical protein